MKKNLPFLMLCLFIIFSWESLVALHILPDSLFPPPREILKALQESPDEWFQALKETSAGSLMGLCISLAGGFSFALLFSLFSWTKRAFLPLAVFFQTVPIIAIAPLLVIYFGFGQPTVIASSAIVAFFPVLASFLLGLENIEKEKLELFELYGASTWQTLIKLKLPSAFLSLYSGLKIAVGLSLIGAIAGEFVAGGGLGAIIDAARTQQRVDRIFAALLLLSLMGIGFLSLLRLIFKSINRTRPFGAASEELR